MNKLIATFAILAVLGAGTWWYASNQDSEQSVLQNQNDSLSTAEVTPTAYIDPAESAGQYTTFSPELVQLASADRKVILFFHAPWCPTCRAADNVFSITPSSIPDNMIVLKTDYDSQTELKRRYDVNYQHTFVQVDAEGNQIAQWNGGDVENLRKNVR